MRRAYTLVEVLIALVILSILAVPLGYVLETMSDGSRRARQQDQALDLAREAWIETRSEDPDSLRDSSWERSPGGSRWKIERDVFDSADRALAGMPPLRASDPAAPPVEVSVCALVSERGTWDTVRCFRWLRPRWRVVP